jgi:hypothetical protein
LEDLDCWQKQAILHLSIHPEKTIKIKVLKNYHFITRTHKNREEKNKETDDPCREP